MRWIGTINGGLVKMQDTVFTTYNIANSAMPDNSILGMKIDPAGVKWMACPAGALVSYLNSFFFTYSTASSGNPSNTFDAIALDSLQDIYLGSFNKGLVKKSGNNFYSWYTQNSPMPDDIVYSVAVERTGIIWAGTSVQGLVRLDESLLTSVDETEMEISYINLYPNPAKDELYIIGYPLSEKTEIEIYDAVGQKVFSAPQVPLSSMGGDEWGEAINVSSLSAGIYFLRLNSEQGAFTRKFVKGN
jgi:hypothetical protein